MRCISSLALLFLALAGTLTASAEPKPQRRYVTLNSALELARRNNLDLHSVLAQIDQANARKRQASAAAMPKIVGTALLAPTFAVTGNALQSESDWSRWGVWLQSSITILQPIYTWGKIASLKTAAESGMQVAQGSVKKTQDEIAYETKELYYGAIFAEQLFQFLEDGKNDVNKIIEKAEVDQKKKRPKIDRRDFYRLKVFGAEAQYRYGEALKARTLARHALSLKLGFDPDEETIPQETSLEPISAIPPTEQELVHKMMEKRAEFLQLRGGIAAKKALLESERANKYPMFFAGGNITMAYSNVRQQQSSAYAFDPYNRSLAGVGLGLQWNFDFATISANEALMQAEISELERKESYAQVGFRMELKKILADLNAAKQDVDSSRDAFQVGRKWLVSEQMGYSVGIAETKNLIDAYIARAKTTKDYWESIYRLNMAWASLSKATGEEVTPTLQ